KLLASTDLSDKKQMLKKYTENIDDTDKELLELVHDVIVGYEQKGKIIEALKDETEKLKNHNEGLLEDADKRIDKMVTNLNEQVEDANEQRLKITYDAPLIVGQG